MLIKMKDSKKVVIFFLILFIFLWNPLSYHFFYKNKGLCDTNMVSLLYLLTPIICLSIIFILKKSSLLNKVQNLIFGISFLGILIGLSIVINFIIGQIIQPSTLSYESNTIKKIEGLIFEPNTKAHYKTVEFDYNALINSIGLRNKDVSISKSEGTYRILCFGDSWTFGWGVDIENSYPMQLEEYLKREGYTNIEVINCGRGGQYTSTYKKFMQKVVPILKPDLVLVGVLQLDDLAQLFEEKIRNDKIEIKSVHRITTVSRLKCIFKAFIKASYSNYFDLLREVKEEDKIEIKTSWKESSTKIIKNLHSFKKLQYMSLTDTVRTLFKTGNLNPGLLHYYIGLPNRSAIFNNPQNSSTTYAIDKMTRDIDDMKKISFDNGAKLIFINLPTDKFTGHRVVRTPADIFSQYFTDNNKIDSIYRSIASINEIPYFQLTERFVKLKDKEKYFFLFDGHPNEKGYKEIADGIGEYLVKYHLTKE